MKYYIPSWNGDYRLEPSADGKGCVLTVTDPTPAEEAVLKGFLKQARTLGWSRRRSCKKPVELRCTVAEAGSVLVQGALPSSSITAVRFSGGEVEVATDARSEGSKKLVAAGQAAKAPAAASVKRPTLCCPSCVPGSVEPATEVLLEFLDEEQHEDWARDRRIQVYGGSSGHRYLLAHRNSPQAVEWGRMGYDLDDGLVMHWHDWSVPPEEEVLACKLLLESPEHEPWLRNQATTHPQATDVYRNPFYADWGQGLLDGVPDAGLFLALGSMVQATMEHLRGRG